MLLDLLEEPSPSVVFALDVELLGPAQHVSIERNSLVGVIGLQDETQLPDCVWRYATTHLNAPVHAFPEPTSPRPPRVGRPYRLISGDNARHDHPYETSGIGHIRSGPVDGLLEAGTADIDGPVTRRREISGRSTRARAGSAGSAQALLSSVGSCRRLPASEVTSPAMETAR